MRFTPITPERLVDDLATWIDGRWATRTRIVVDGFVASGADAVADAVARTLRARGRPAVRVSTRWWWRPASLRLEYGRTDVDMLLGGWVDTTALRREVLEPLGPDGAGTYLPRLRDPETHRSIRDRRVRTPDRTVLVIDTPFALAWGTGAEALIHLRVSPAALTRHLPAELGWWIAAHERYLAEYDPIATADVVLAYDHPAAPAIWWTPGRIAPPGGRGPGR